ncbi:hypothetical protein D9C73_007911 [Collichthys lucidus]|uniref:Uncharacterized protein n=1 Tax=Collichthys lucidus TaxID=240159 RepID=A0A4U5UI58_COLLU|nr:hypothetical protein D9C73_007911 [Collichthys lucidus]
MSEPQTASGENFCKRVLKWKVRKDDEGPSTRTQKKRNVRNDTECASSSVCPDRVQCSLHFECHMRPSSSSETRISCECVRKTLRSGPTCSSSSFTHGLDTIDL